MSNPQEFRILFELGEDEAKILLAFLVDVPTIRPEHRAVVLELQNGILAAIESSGEDDDDEE